MSLNHTFASFFFFLFFLCWLFLFVRWSQSEDVLVYAMMIMKWSRRERRENKRYQFKRRRWHQGQGTLTHPFLTTFFFLLSGLRYSFASATLDRYAIDSRNLRRKGEGGTDLAVGCQSHSFSVAQSVTPSSPLLLLLLSSPCSFPFPWEVARCGCRCDRVSGRTRTLLVPGMERAAVSLLYWFVPRLPLVILGPGLDHGSVCCPCSAGRLPRWSLSGPIRLHGSDAS